MSSQENAEDHLARIFCENLEGEADWNADADELGMLAATFTDIATTERPAFVEQWVKVVEEALEGSAAEGRTEAAVRTALLLALYCRLFCSHRDGIQLLAS